MRMQARWLDEHGKVLKCRHLSATSPAAAGRSLAAVLAAAVVAWGFMPGRGLIFQQDLAIKERPGRLLSDVLQLGRELCLEDSRGVILRDEALLRIH
jgi:hypothetical protein